MTIREIAEANGNSVQNIYKKLKSRKIGVATLKDETGQLTEAGEQTILELLKAAPADVPPPVSEELNQLKTEVEKLKISCQLLTTQVEMLTKENDRLHEALQREQAVSGMALQKIALPAPADSTGFTTRLKRWFKKGGAADGHQGK